MGGRGSSSSSGKFGELDINDPAESGNGSFVAGIIGSKEDRPDIKSMSNMASLRDIDGTGDIPTGILNSQLIQLQNLNKKFHAINNDVLLVGVDGARDEAVAAVSYDEQSNRQTLMMNINHFKTVKDMHESQKLNEAFNQFMPTNSKITSSIYYAVTHEYGHLLHNFLYMKAKAAGYKGTRKQFVSNAWKAVERIANRKFNAPKTSMSAYGNTNTREAFAEAFANSQLGNPNEVGKAMNYWLKSQGFNV